MIIRPETPADFAHIANIHQLAFDKRLDEAQIVALLRQRYSYDNDLSLVAEQNGVIVGHVLFTPTTIRLMGDSIKAVLLAPIGVLPDHQKQGIGGKLIIEGHRIAKEKGYPLSFLVGHHTYYPHYGYITYAFGSSSVTVDTTLLPPDTDEKMTTHPVSNEDLPALMNLWAHEETNVDFSIMPETTLTDWLSPNPLVQSTVYKRAGDVVGYTRIRQDMPAEPLIFLAKNTDIARLMAHHIASISPIIKLPLHPNSASIGTFGTADYRAWQAAMACPLIKDSPLDAYFDAVQAGKRVAGRPIWGTCFELP